MSDWIKSKWKKVITILILLILIVFISNISLFKKQEVPKSQIIASGGNYNKDSDNDGLKDWEEILYNTNPNIPDDVNNIKQKTNQLDYLEVIDSGTNNSYRKYMTTENSLVSTDGTTYKYSTGLIKSVSDSISDDKQKEIRTFANSLATQIIKHLDNISDETSVFFSIIEEPTRDNMLSLNIIGKKYLVFVEDIKKLNVPPRLSNCTNELIDSYQLHSENIIELSEMKYDNKIPADKFIKYNKGVLRNGQAIISLMKLLKNIGIIFNPDEPAYIFNM